MGSLEATPTPNGSGQAGLPTGQVGARLKKHRVAAGLTQQQLAIKANVSYFTIAKLEQGSTKQPSTTVLYKLASALDFDIDQFLGKGISRHLDAGIKFVYSDIGGVLVHTEAALFPHLSADYNRSVDSIRTIYHHYMPSACRGNLSGRDLQMLMLLKLNLKFVTDRKHKLLKHWVDYMSPINETQAFLQSIASKYSVGLLTDTVDGFVERMQQRKLLPELKYRVIIKSSDVGATKPDPKIFAVATKAAGVEQRQILFIDDKKMNVRGARAVGWHAEWFNELNPKASIARIRRKYF